MITTLEGWLLIYFSGNKERDLVQITWYCRTGIRWLILLRISNKALTEISKRLPFNQRSCSFLCLLPMPHPQHPTTSGSDAAAWHAVTTADQRLLRIHFRWKHQGKKQEWDWDNSKRLQKGEKGSPAILLYWSKSWLSILVEFAEGWFNSYWQHFKQRSWDSLIRPTRTAPSKPTFCPHLGAF